ncbi:MAG: deoxyribodipyrimidine photo-lyase [Pseudomonadota bacterium]
MTTDLCSLTPGSRTLYWFRNDLRLGDNPALTRACAAEDIAAPQEQDESAGLAHDGHHRGLWLRGAA